MFEMIVTGQGDLVLTHNEDYIADQRSEGMSDYEFFIAALCHTHKLTYSPARVVVLDDPRAGELEQVA